MIDLISPIFNFKNQVKSFIYNLYSQTSQEWRLHLISDGDDPDYDEVKTFIESLNDNRIRYEMMPNRYNDWGHSLRDYSVRRLPQDSKYVIMMNADDLFYSNYLKSFNDTIKIYNPDIAFCNFFNNKFDGSRHNSLYNTQLKFAEIDMACFCVRSDWARQNGFNSRIHSADWEYMNEILSKHASPKIVKINLCLYTHQ